MAVAERLLLQRVKDPGSEAGRAGEVVADLPGYLIGGEESDTVDGLDERVGILADARRRVLAPLLQLTCRRCMLAWPPAVCYMDSALACGSHRMSKARGHPFGAKGHRAREEHRPREAFKQLL